MSIRITALKSVCINGLIFGEAYERSFLLQKGNSTESVMIINGVCEAKNKVKECFVSIPEKVGEKVFHEDLIGIERLA